jgi:uncharacterized protein YoxC
MLWLRIALLGVIAAAIAAAVFKVTSFLHDKDLTIQKHEQTIRELTATIEGLRIDADRLKQSNASLEGEVARKRDELARADLEAKKISVTDQASSKRLGELERKLNDQERIAKIERLSHSRRAELTLQVVNKSARCELENYFRTGGQCKGGEWVEDGARLSPKVEKAPQTQGQGVSNETQKNETR